MCSLSADDEKEGGSMDEYERLSNTRAPFSGNLLCHALTAICGIHRNYATFYLLLYNADDAAGLSRRLNLTFNYHAELPFRVRINAIITQKDLAFFLHKISPLVKHQLSLSYVLKEDLSRSISQFVSTQLMVRHQTHQVA